MSNETQNCRVCGAELGQGRFCHQCGAVVQVAPGTDPLIGRVLNDRYRVLRVLGEGGMGVVYEGEQTIGGSSRRVAIKTLRDVNDPVLVARFYRECETLAGLAHPNTVRVFDYGETSDGVLFIVMEYVDGKSLSDLLEEEGHLSPSRAARIVRQVASALSEAHGQGVIHRDLKPDNIYVVRRGDREVVKLLDFGIARRCRPEGTTQDVKLTNDGSVLGTPAYMSPEQFTESSVDEHSDIYSLAIITYELLTGELPYEDANTPWQWATRHMSSQPVPMATRGFTADPAIETVILKGLDKDPTKRPDTALEFAELFDSAVQGTLDTQEVPSSRGNAARTGTEAMRAAPGHTGVPTQASMGAMSPMAMQPLVFTPMPQERPRKRSKLPAILATLALAFGGATLAVAMDQGLLNGEPQTVATQELSPAAQLTEVAPIEAEPPAQATQEPNQSIPEEPLSKTPTAPRAPSRPAPAPAPAPTPEPTVPGVVLPLPIPTFTPPATSEPEPPPAPAPTPTTPTKPRLDLPGLLKKFPQVPTKPSASPAPSSTAPAPAPKPAPSTSKPRLRLPQLKKN